jgi:sulfide:quinone oxidoreductase
MFVGDGKLMLMEFKYGKESDESFSRRQYKPSRLYFLMKKYLFSYLYWNFLPKGIWYGRNGFMKPNFK